MKSLQKIQGFAASAGPVVLVVMDGVGIGSQDERDGVYSAHTPVLDALFRQPLMTRLKAHGKAVGLPSDDDMGNSEVGHNALGAGRVFSQGAKLVNEAIASKTIFSGKAWREAIRWAQKGTFHFIGLVSDGNVHSHINQLFSLLDQCVSENVQRVRVHVLLDGRDVGEKSALDYIRPLQNKLDALSADGRDYRIASGGGRMVTTMDRYNANWPVVENGWKTHVLGQGRKFASAEEAIITYYTEDAEITDQYLPSFVLAENDKAVGEIVDGDAVVFFNFRGDRAIEISRAFEEEDFTEFDRVRLPKVFYAGMMQYDGDAQIPHNYLVEPPIIDQTLSEFLAASGVRSYAISETQKFGHVTYFWNGNKSGYVDASLERYEEILSDRVRFEQRPWMKAAEITDKVIDEITDGKARFIRLNYPNGDMVGHTGVVDAIRIAVETVDLCLGRLLQVLAKKQGIAIITADHGNADCMWTEKKGKRSPMVAHTLNPVPCIVVDYSQKNTFSLAAVEQPGLANVAATLCVLLGYQPPDFYAPSLVQCLPGVSSSQGELND